MIERIFPRRIDNDYQGHRLGLWLLGLVLLIRLAMGTNMMINTREIAQGADGIPIDGFAPAAADAVIGMFALLGLGKWALGLLGLLALVRYRAMVPLVFLLMLVDHVAARLLLLARPVVRGETTTTAISVNLIVFTLLLAGLALSLWRPKRSRGA